jgi:hypothetical protein
MQESSAKCLLPTTVSCALLENMQAVLRAQTVKHVTRPCIKISSVSPAVRAAPPSHVPPGASTVAEQAPDTVWTAHQVLILYSRFTHTVLILYSYCTHTALILYAVLILYSYCTHTVLIPYSYCTHTLLYSYCTHTVLIIYSYCTHTVLILYSHTVLILYSYRTHTVLIPYSYCTLILYSYCTLLHSRPLHRLSYSRQ